MLGAVEGADVEAQLGAVQRFPAREPDIVGEARPVVGFRDEAQPLLAEPAVAGGTPFQDEAAADLREAGAGLRLGQAQAVGGAMRQELDRRRRRDGRCGHAASSAAAAAREA